MWYPKKVCTFTINFFGSLSDFFLYGRIRLLVAYRLHCRFRTENITAAYPAHPTAYPCHTVAYPACPAAFPACSVAYPAFPGA